MPKPAYSYPPPHAEPSYRPPPAWDEYSRSGGGGSRGSGMVYVLMLVVVAAFAGVVWNIYGTHAPPPRIAAPSGAYRVAPSAEAAVAAEPVDDNAMYQALEDHNTTPAPAPAATTPRPAPEAPLANANASPVPGPPQIAAAPAFAANGPYVAQVAALQSEAAVEAAWARLASRAPQLFSTARMDVERADLGQRGVYFRVRAGYFADRANASRFCDRIKQMGQDCIVVTR